MSYNENAVYGAPVQNYGQIQGASAQNASKESLKAALDYWSAKSRPMMGLAEYMDTGIERLWGNPLTFTRGQEVIDQMLNYNDQLGGQLTTEELIGGLNKFSESQYNTYNTGYAVDSDPFNIGRWSVAQALIDKGSPETGYGLIRATDGQQALTSQQAIEIGKQATARFNELAGLYQQGSQQHNASFGEILGALATGVGVAALPFAAAGALGGFSGAADFGSIVPAAGEATPLGSLGSGTFGVELGGLGTYGTTPIMAGELGTGLAGTSLASLGLDASALGGLGTIAAANSTPLPVTGDFPTTSSGELAFDDAIQQGTGLNSPDTPWAELNRTLNQTLAENPLLEQGVNAAKTIKSATNAYNTVDGIYDMLTTEPQAQQAPLQQIQAQQGRGYMTQPFGNRNFDAYR